MYVHPPELTCLYRVSASRCVRMSTCTWTIHGTVEARKLEYDCPPTTKPREEGHPAYINRPRPIIPYSNFLESKSLLGPSPGVDT